MCFTFCKNNQYLVVLIDIIITMLAPRKWGCSRRGRRRERRELNRVRAALAADAAPRVSGRVFPTPHELACALETLCLIDPRKSAGLANMIKVFGIVSEDPYSRVYEEAVLRHQALTNAAVTVDIGDLVHGHGLYWPGLMGTPPLSAWLNGEQLGQLGLPTTAPDR